MNPCILDSGGIFGMDIPLIGGRFPGNVKFGKVDGIGKSGKARFNLVILNHNRSKSENEMKSYNIKL